MSVTSTTAAAAPSTCSIAALAWPIAVNAVFLQSIIVVDTLLVSPLGEQALAGLGLATSFAAILNGVLFAFSNGSQILLAQAFGAKDKATIERRFFSGLLINLAIAVVGVVCIFALAPTLFGMLAATPAMAAQALEYLSVFALAVLMVAVAQNANVYFNAMGKSRIPLYSNLIALPVNALLSYLLIHGLWGLPQMGVAGAALGSAVSVMLRAVFLMAALHRIDAGFYAGAARRWLPPVAVVAEHFRRALPIAGTFVSMTLSFNVCMLIYAKLGVQQFAALTLLFPWIRVAGTLALAWGQASGIIVGQILGSKAWGALDDFVSRAWRIALLVALFVAIFYFAMFYLFEHLYLDLQAETVRYLWQLMPLLVALPFVRVSNTFCGHVLRAGGDAGYVFKVHACTQWFVTVPLSAVFVLVLDLSVLWVFAVVLLEELCKALPFHLRMWAGQWKRDLSSSDAPTASAR